ncbi:MAG: flagellar filament capping protein FliD [Pseudomonadota bacterium]|nr:flagellar filament capping protein FliD [Pseudomonadota bacterium]
MTSINDKPDILTSLGVGSGIDTTKLVKALVEAETEGPKEDLAKKEEAFKATISAFASIKNNLKIFNENLEIIQNNNSLGYQGSTSDKTVATFTVNGNESSTAVNSSLTVSTLATAHTLTGPSLASTSATVGARTIAISFGTWSADPTQGGGQSFTSNGQNTISVTATSSTTLAQLRDMINNAATDSDNDGQKDALATIIYDGSNYMLALKSEFGAANEMKITDNHASAPVYAYDTTDGAQLTQRVAGINSSFTVDGISMTRSSNRVDDLYSGMTLELLSTSGTAINIKSEVDLASARESIESFVVTYNEVYNSLNSLREKDPNNEESGKLAGDSLLRGIMSQMRSSNSTAIAGYSGGPYYMSNLGVKTNRDGTLSFADPTMLERTFKYNSESLRSFFKDQIVSDNPNIIPLRYNKDTTPGSYAVVNNSGTATVGGVSTSASGTTYTVASGAPEGIMLTINASTTSGTVHYGRSFITQLQDKLETYIKWNGLIESKLEGQNQRLREIGNKREALDDRIAKLYQRYHVQYSSMESTIAGLKETGSLLENAFKRNSD